MCTWLVDCNDVLSVHSTRRSLRTVVGKIHECQHYSGEPTNYKVFEYADGHFTPVETVFINREDGTDDYYHLNYALQVNGKHLLSFTLTIDGRA